MKKVKKRKKEFFYIYEIRNIISNWLYRGRRSSFKPFEEDTEYMGSSPSLTRHMTEIGQENFTKILVEYCKDSKELGLREEFHVDQKWCDREDTYNIVPANGNWIGIAGLVCIYNEKTIECIRVKKNLVSGYLKNGWKKGNRIIRDGKLTTQKRFTEEELYKKMLECKKLDYQKNPEKHKVRREKWYSENRDEKLEYQKDYAKDHKEEKSEYDKLYYQENKEKLTEYKKEYRKNNAEKLSKYDKEYRKKNREHDNEVRKKYRKKNRKKLNKQAKEYRKNNKKEISARNKIRYENDKETIKIKNKEKYEKDKDNINAKARKSHKKNKDKKNARRRELAKQKSDAKKKVKKK